MNRISPAPSIAGTDLCAAILVVVCTVVVDKATGVMLVNRSERGQVWQWLINAHSFQRRVNLELYSVPKTLGLGEILSFEHTHEAASSLLE